MRSVSLIFFARVLPAALLLLAGAVTGLLLSRSAIQDHEIKMRVRVGGDVVDIAEHVEIGGIPQWISMRGQDKDNPVLLYIHGGPGAPSSGYAYSYQYPWEDIFTVVHWDQRGSGRSIPDGGVPVRTMTVEQMLVDAIEVVDHLRKRFDQEKIFVIGKSWGSQLGALLAKRHPEMLHAYISIGQTVSWRENFEESRRLLIELAEQRGDWNVVDSLLSAGDMPTPSDLDSYWHWIRTVQSPLYGYGKYWHAQNSPGAIPGRMIVTALMSPDMTLSEIYGFIGGDAADYVSHLFTDDAHYNFNLHDLGYEFDVPMIMVIGRHDWVTPVTVARAYFEKVQAPYKKYLELDHSAHMAGLYEEPGQVFKMLVTDALPLTQRESHDVTPVLIESNAD